jgi:hypothetical protein
VQAAEPDPLQRSVQDRPVRPGEFEVFYIAAARSAQTRSTFWDGSRIATATFGSLSETFVCKNDTKTRSISKFVSMGSHETRLVD